jgi:hypothetical protein
VAGGSKLKGRWSINSTVGISLFKNHNIHLYSHYGVDAGCGRRGNHTVTGGLCFGGCGSTRPTRPSYAAPGPLGRTVGKAEGQVSSGAVKKVWGRAERASRQFVESLRQQLNRSQPALWREFLEATH